MSEEPLKQAFSPGPADEEQMITAFNGYARQYDEWYDQEQGRLIFETEVQALRAAAADFPTPAVEIGVGSGRFAQALGIESGVDPSRRMLDLAAQKGIHVHLGKGEQPFFEESSQGSVFLITTLCFLKDPLKVLREAWRILKPEGKLVVGFIQKDSAWGQYYQNNQTAGHPLFRHALFFRASEVARVTMQAKFAGDSMVSTLFQKPGEVTRVEEPRPGLFLKAGFVVLATHKTTSGFQ